MLRRKLPEAVRQAGAFSGRALLVLALLAVAAAPPARAQEDAGGEDQELEDEFSEEFELLEQEAVVVTATKQKQTVAAAPAIMAVINREELRRHGYRSVAEALAAVAGVYVNYDYVFYDMGLRGISNELRGASRSIKVLINGQDVSFRADTGNFLGAELIPLEAIDHIEIIRGSASALYGANAFLGVINIITRSGQQLRGAAAKVSSQLFGEAYGGVGLELALGSQLGPLDFFLALSHQYQERSGRKIRCTAAVAGEQPCDYVTGVTGRLLGRPSFDDISQPSSFFSSMALDLGRLFAANSGSWGWLRLQGNVQLLDSRGSFSDWGSLNYDDITDDQGRVTGHQANSGNRVALGNTAFRGQYEISLLQKRLQLKLAAAYSQGGPLDSERLEEVTGVVNRSAYGFRAFDTQAEVSWALLDRTAETDSPLWGVLQRLLLSAGVDFSRDRITYVPVGNSSTMSFTSSTLYNLGAWGQLATTAWDGRLGLVAGVRYDDNRGARVTDAAWQRLDVAERQRLCGRQVCYQELSWRAGATLRLLQDVVALGEDAGFLFDNLHLKLLYGTAFKAPSPLFLYQEGFLGERPINPNPALLPQTVDSLEVLLGSAHWQRRLELALDFFYNHIDNRAEFTREGMAVVASNGVPVKTWGFEFTLRLHCDPLVFRANLSYQHSRRQLGDNLDRRIPDTFGYPDLMANAGLSWYISALGLVAGLDVRYVGARVGHPFNRADRISERYTLAPYLLLDINLATSGWRPWNGKETRLQLGVRNLLGSDYDFPGFQPYYRYDLPGLPRTIIFSVSQEF